MGKHVDEWLAQDSAARMCTDSSIPMPGSLAAEFERLLAQAADMPWPLSWYYTRRIHGARNRVLLGHPAVYVVEHGLVYRAVDRVVEAYRRWEFKRAVEAQRREVRRRMREP